MTLAGRVFAVSLVSLSFTAGSMTAQQRPDAAKVRQQLIGTYKLISYVSYDEKGTATKLPYSVGQIAYDAAGRMSAQLMRADVPATATAPTASTAPPAGAAPAPGAQGGRGGGGTGYIAYFGRYEIDAENSRVFHHVEGSMSRNMVGTAMPRWYEFSPDGNTLFLMTKSGERITGRLQWDRHK